jgi:hypothetical protein
MSTAQSALSLWVKWLGREADYSPPSSVEVKKGGAIFHSRTEHTDKFTFCIYIFHFNHVYISLFLKKNTHTRSRARAQTHTHTYIYIFVHSFSNILFESILKLQYMVPSRFSINYSQEIFNFALNSLISINY